MTGDLNPFASPQTDDLAAKADQSSSIKFPDKMRRVRAGLSLAYLGICGIPLLIIFALVVLFVTGPILNPRPLAQAAGVICLVALAGLGVAIFVGQVMCIAVPRESGAKGWVVAAIILQLSSLLASFGVFVAIAQHRWLFGSISAFLSLMAMLCFLLFLHKTALYVQRGDIAWRAVRSIMVGVVSVLAGLLLLLLPRESLDGELNAVVVILCLVAVFGFLLALIMYANTITYLREAIEV